jgi:hypothetical protein
MSVVKTSLRVRPIAQASDVFYAPSAPLTSYTVQGAIEEVEAQVIVVASSPPSIVPKAVNFAMSPYAVLPTDYLLEVDTTAGAVTLQLGLSALRNNKPVVVKHAAGSAVANPISVTRSGAETIDGLTSYPMDSNFDAKTFTPKLAANGYEVSS